MTIDPVTRTSPPAPLKPAGSDVHERKFATTAAATRATAATQEGDPIPRARSSEDIKTEYKTRYHRDLNNDLADFLSGDKIVNRQELNWTRLQVLDAAARYAFDELGLIDRVNELWRIREETRYAKDAGSKARYDKATEEFGLIFYDNMNGKVKTKDSYWGLGASYFYGLKDFAEFVRRVYPNLRT